MGVKRLERVFKFKNFAEALGFTNKVGAIAEDEDHHPLIITEWGRVTLNWWSQKIKGLHQNDFIMDAKTESSTDKQKRPWLECLYITFLQPIDAILLRSS